MEMTGFRLVVHVAFVSVLASAVLICSEGFGVGQGVTAPPAGVLGRRSIDCQYHAAGKSLPGCPGTAATPSSAAELVAVNLGNQQSRVSTHRRQLLQSEFQPTALAEWEQSSQLYAKKYAKGSCFEDYSGFIAKDITEFVRLIKDPAATHIELKGDLVFTHDLFPPENAHDQSKGINVTHQVEIRACTGPVIVDVNNLLQQVYVYGSMVWQGSIKFINSFPSPRRGGLFPLISVLSAEGDGRVEFKGLQIHGNEPSPLFNYQDPYWEVYQNDSKFVPQPDQYTRVDSHTLVMHNWTFNKAAWVLRSQGKSGVVPAQGAASWLWEDVLISWSPPASSGGGLQGAALALAVALPVVLSTLLLVAGAAVLWWCCRRKRRQQGQVQASVVEQQKPALTVQPSGPSKASTGGFGPSSHTGGSTGECASKLEMSSASLATTQLIEQARRRMQATSATREASVVLESLLGEGTFGKVYSANWKGSLVAVKTMLLPAAMSGKERREKMAIMETAISSSLSHPNIVQTYTYEVKPLTGELARKALESKANGSLADPTTSHSSFLDDPSSTADNHGWEVRLVLELCDLGNLKEFLGRGGFQLGNGMHDMAAIVATSLDIARAMLHLHTENIIHSDLKARNVLLKSAGADARGFVAKVSDFGLSMRIDPSETHVSNFYQGTLTHVAPEVLMFGKISFASDVYAFGIMLWEMYTAMQAFKGVPRALLGHEVTTMGRRPEFPPDCPFDYQLLACRCWESDPAIRPTFAQILADLERMGSKLQQARRRMDSASSLPFNTSVAGRRSSSNGPRSPLGDAAGPLEPLSAASISSTAHGGAAGAAAAGGLGFAAGAADPSKYHNWEPQTSLLELGSTLTGTAGLTAPPVETQTETSASHQKAVAAHQQAAAVAASATTSNASFPSQDRGQVGSLGPWDAPSGGGLWFSGSLAPVSLPDGLQVVQGQVVAPGQAAIQHSQQAAAAALGPVGLMQPEQCMLTAVQQQAGGQQQQQLQHHPAHAQLYNQQLLSHQQQQQQQQHHQGYGLPPLQPPGQAGQQPQQQGLQQYMQLLLGQRQQQHGGAQPCSDGSSSGVYVENSSTLLNAGIPGPESSGCNASVSSSGLSNGQPDPAKAKEA